MSPRLKRLAWGLGLIVLLALYTFVDLTASPAEGEVAVGVGR